MDNFRGGLVRVHANAVIKIYQEFKRRKHPVGSVGDLSGFLRRVENVCSEVS